MKALLFAARQASDALGICFHVGSQAMSPAAYAEAMGRVRDAIVEAAVTVDIVDVGGGFPSLLSGHGAAAARGLFRRSSTRAFEALPISYSAELWCEPGRALCAEYASLLVRVEKRRGSELYINDGAYGALFDAAHIGWRYPVRLVRERGSNVRADGRSASTGRPATTSTIWRGRSSFPADVAAGDYIEIGMLGAYGCAMRTGFNGFGVERTEIVDDEPMATLYAEPSASSAFERRHAVELSTPRHPRAGGDPACFSSTIASSGIPAFAGMTMEHEMTTDTLNKVQDAERDQRHAQGRAAVEPGRAYRHHQASTPARSSRRWAR